MEVLLAHFFLAACEGNTALWTSWNRKNYTCKSCSYRSRCKFIDMSIFITSKWFGEIEKYVEAIFSLASKLSPAVIFVDEIDRLLGNREKPGQHEAMRRMKNEFMVNWDVLRTKDQEHVIILGATNRPFDLDDDVIQRFPHSLCFTAVRCPIREIIEKEKKGKSLAIAEGRPEPPLYGGKDVRPLGMVDLKFALGQLRASIFPDSTIMNQLVKWNDEFGGGGSRKKETLGYFM